MRRKPQMLPKRLQQPPLKRKQQPMLKKKAAADAEKKAAADAKKAAAAEAKKKLPQKPQQQQMLMICSVAWQIPRMHRKVVPVQAPPPPVKVAARRVGRQQVISAAIWAKSLLQSKVNFMMLIFTKVAPVICELNWHQMVY